MNIYHIFSAATVDYLQQFKLISIGLKKYKKPDVKYIYHIMLDDKEPNQYRSIFKNIIADDFDIDFMSSDLVEFKMSKEVIECRMKMSYARLLTPYLFPDLDKILVLDADLLILKDGIDQLFEQDISNFNLAAVLDIPTQIVHPDHVKNSNVQMYFNAGVMLLNLKKIRAEGIDKDLEKDIMVWPKEIEKNLYNDQDIFNYRFNEEVLWLSPIYNHLLYSNPLVNMKSFNYIYKQCGFDKPIDALPEVVVVHWAGSAKPFIQGKSFDYIACPYWTQSKMLYKETKKMLEEYINE